MAKGRGSLVDQLADLNNVAPVDYEFEDEAGNFDAGRKAGAESDESEGEEDVARSHAMHNLIKVAPSEMRRKANFIEDVNDETRRRYKGVKTTREEMFADGEEDSMRESQEEEGDEDDDDDDDEMSESASELEEESEEEQSIASEHDVSEDKKGSDESMSTSSVREAVQVKSRKKSLRFADEEAAPSNGAAKAVQSDAALLEELRKRAKVEAQRGRDTKRQMDAWGKLLGARIRAQKPVRGVTRISTDSMNAYIRTCSMQDQASYDETLSTLDQLSAFLFALQDRLLRSYASTSDDDTASVRKSLHALHDSQKRCTQMQKRKLDDEEFDAHLDTALSLDERIHGPLWRSVLAKWSWRTSANTSIDEANKRSSAKFDSKAGGGGLKAVNQSAQDQIERGMRGEAYERLRKRTRVWRGNEKESRVITSKVGDTEPAVAAPTAVEDIDVFDDSDFYAALLRELIDSRAEGAAHGNYEQVSSAWAQAANRASKKHRDVDRGASKGRRLRYDVHEKVQNFMPPIPAETWSAEQIDRLMHQIRSGNAGMQAEPAITEHTDEVVQPVELGGLRLFG